MDNEEAVLPGIEATPAEPAPETTPAEEQEGGETPAPAAPAKVDWTSQPLPDGHPGLQKGFKTWGDFDRDYQRVHAVAELTPQYKQALTEVLARIKSGREAAPPPAAPKPSPGGYFGFPDKAAFDRAYSIDPEGTLRKMTEHTVNPLLEERLKPVLERQQADQQEMQEAKFERGLTLLRAQAQELQSRWPEAKVGSPLHEATTRFLAANPWAGQLIDSLPPHVNKPEIVFKLATYEILREQAQAAQAKLATKRASAATVRPGTGGKASPKNPTWEETVKQLAAENGATEAELEAALTQMGPRK